MTKKTADQDSDNTPPATPAGDVPSTAPGGLTEEAIAEMRAEYDAIVAKVATARSALVEAEQPQDARVPGLKAALKQACDMLEIRDPSGSTHEQTAVFRALL